MQASLLLTAIHKRRFPMDQRSDSELIDLYSMQTRASKLNRMLTSLIILDDYDALIKKAELIADQAINRAMRT